jgi:hypothetical protein
MTHSRCQNNDSKIQDKHVSSTPKSSHEGEKHFSEMDNSANIADEEFVLTSLQQFPTVQ